MANRIDRNRKKRRFVLAFIVVLAFAAFWFSGLAGELLVYRLLPSILPVRVGDDVDIRNLRLDTGAQRPDRGLILILSTTHLKSMLKGAFPSSWWMFPRGIIRDRVQLSGTWMPHGVKMPDTEGIPVCIAVDDAVGAHPKLLGNYQVSVLNEILKDEDAFNLKQTEEWALGKYETVYHIIFGSIDIVSDQDVDVSPLEKRQLRFDAKGWVKIRASQAFIKAAATAEVDDFKGRFDLKIARDDRGLIFSYDSTIDSLKGDVHNVAPWADEKICKALQDSLTRSLNRSKQKDKLTQERFPAWLPLDVLVDIKIVPDKKADGG